MTRYIDADALKDCIEKEVYAHDYIEHVYQIIDECPTADVVEVVRCKDCQHRTYDNYSDVWCCTKCGYELGEENNFCSWGKRKGGYTDD